MNFAFLREPRDRNDVITTGWYLMFQVVSPLSRHVDTIILLWLALIAILGYKSVIYKMFKMLWRSLSQPRGIRLWVIRPWVAPSTAWESVEISAVGTWQQTLNLSLFTWLQVRRWPEFLQDVIYTSTTVTILQLYVTYTYICIYFTTSKLKSPCRGICSYYYIWIRTSNNIERKKNNEQLEDSLPVS